MSSKPPLPDLSKGFFDNPPALLSLAQARRDALCVALGYCDATEVWVALFDFAMTINAMSDWVRNARPDLERQTRELARNPEMGAWRDIANAGKHVKLDRAYSGDCDRADRGDRLRNVERCWSTRATLVASESEACQ
jgi:hypothetical protein